MSKFILIRKGRGGETLQTRRSLHCHCRQISETWDLHCVSWIAWQWEDMDTSTQHERTHTDPWTHKFIWYEPRH